MNNAASLGVVRARAEAMWAEDRASIGLGMRLDDVAPGRARLSMTITEAMANGHGICHGGFIFALADSAMARCQSAWRTCRCAARVDQLYPSGAGRGRAGGRRYGANACRPFGHL